MADRALIARFESKVEKTDGCWLWTAETASSGYGRFRVGSSLDGTRRKVQAHRLSYELYRGEIADGLFVLHRCDNRRCVRPDHLVLGTQADNMLDAKLKGRLGGRGNRTRQKLSPADDAKILELTDKGFSQREIGRMLGVSCTMVWVVRHGRCRVAKKERAPRPRPAPFCLLEG